MAVVTKKIGRKEYAYFVAREGGKVVHRYLGPPGSQLVREIVLNSMEAVSVPEHFRSLFWDTDLKNIQIGRNARYIIERVLELGDLDAVEWLQRVYPVRTILHAVYMSRTLTEKSRNFWKIWFGVGDA